MEVIRVLLADDHTIVRGGIRLLLDTQPDIKIIGEAEEGAEAVNKARQLKPDVVLMDLTMPGMNGLEATRLIKKEEPNIKVLVLTMHDNEEYFFQALGAGASGYIPKKADPMELASAIRAIRQRGAFLYPTVAKALMADYVRRVEAGEEKASYDGLTNREKEIVKLLAEGRTNRDIANLLHISVKTADRHRANVMRKLGIHNRAQLIKYAVRKGLTDTEM